MNHDRARADVDRALDVARDRGKLLSPTTVRVRQFPLESALGEKPASYFAPPRSRGGVIDARKISGDLVDTKEVLYPGKYHFKGRGIQYPSADMLLAEFNNRNTLYPITQHRGNWIQTYTGRQFWPLDPRAEDVDIADIAHALSMLCRFTGHCERFYSVAEHSVLLARWVRANVYDGLPFEALMHDASEAYLTDVPRPVKPFLAGYAAAESAVDAVIRSRFRMCSDLPRHVKDADRRILTDEMQQNMKKPPVPWDDVPEPLDIQLKFWSPKKAERKFLEMFEELGG